jgi:hypothetical protein
MVPAKKRYRTIEVMVYEGQRIAALYNTPRVDLRFAGFPSTTRASRRPPAEVMAPV